MIMYDIHFVDKGVFMGQYEELITLLDIENDKDEREMIDEWIKRSGLEKVYQECLKIYNEEK